MKWSINSLMVMDEAQPDTVTMSNFTISDTQDGLSGSVTYAVNLLPAGEPFTPFDQITEDQAIGWTQDALGVDRVAAMEAEVQSQIDAQKIPEPKIAPLPWVVPTEAPAEEA